MHKFLLKVVCVVQNEVAVEEEIWKNGRVLLRQAGTERRKRVMEEGSDEPGLDKAMEKLVTAIESYRKE